MEHYTPWTKPRSLFLTSKSKIRMMCYRRRSFALAINPSRNYRLKHWSPTEIKSLQDKWFPNIFHLHHSRFSVRHLLRPPRRRRISSSIQKHWQHKRCRFFIKPPRQNRITIIFWPTISKLNVSIYRTTAIMHRHLRLVYQHQWTFNSHGRWAMVWFRRRALSSRVRRQIPMLPFLLHWLVEDTIRPSINQRRQSSLVVKHTRHRWIVARQVKCVKQEFLSSGWCYSSSQCSFIADLFIDHHQWWYFVSYIERHSLSADFFIIDWLFLVAVTCRSSSTSDGQFFWAPALLRHDSPSIFICCSFSL